MARWEPNARERLVRAAVDLFSEQGYEATTVAEIAERAGLTKTTFFRHFPDKREVLFAGQDAIARNLADGAAAAPGDATPLEVVAAALEAAAAAFGPAQQEFGPRLRAVIAANSELRERAALKSESFLAAMTGALRKRGVPDRAAVVAAGLGALAFGRAFDRWTEPGCQRSFPDLARQELRDLRTAAAALT